MSNLNSQGDLDAFLKEYLGQNSILIVDSVSGARVSLAASLLKLGAAQTKIILASSIEEARSKIARVRPKIIFTDLRVRQTSGLSLLRKDELKETLFVVVTSNASQTAVSRAAQEGVDAFILKPYSLDSLRKILANTVREKFSSGDYFLLPELDPNHLRDQSV